MNDRDSGWDVSDLEKEIDAAVDRLFVEETGAKNQEVQAEQQRVREQPKPEPREPEPHKPEPEERVTVPVRKPVGLGQGIVGQELEHKFEEVEAQLLTLEWDINAKQMTRAMNLLQDLRGVVSKGSILEAVVVQIQKILNHIFLDDSKLTPDIVKLLLKLWKGAKRMRISLT